MENFKTILIIILVIIIALMSNVKEIDTNKQVKIEQQKDSIKEVIQKLDTIYITNKEKIEKIKVEKNEKIKTIDTLNDDELVLFYTNYLSKTNYPK